MKVSNRINFFILCFIVVLFAACSSNNDEAALKCYNCDVNTQGAPDDIDYCDNGDGTMNLFFKGTGKNSTVNLQGNSFDDFIVTARTFGTCVEIKGK